ncbi:GDSL esterase/lipase-like protein [Tanacetum coccineum]
MGEIGGNDYNHALVAGKSIDDVQPYVPLVLNAIVMTLNVGVTAFLTIYYGSSDDEYDSTTGCLIRLNKFAEYHNELLQSELNRIRELHPNVNIIYGDYYNAAMQFFRSPDDFGFPNGALKACCGGKGPYNYNQSTECASPFSTSCAQPNTYANWDGLHLTEAAYRVIYKSLFEGSYTMPQFNSLCTINLGKSGSSRFDQGIRVPSHNGILSAPESFKTKFSAAPRLELVGYTVLYLQSALGIQMMKNLVPC